MKENQLWVLCPICNNKTRIKIRDDTELINFPLFCPKCKQETLINIKHGNIIIREAREKAGLSRNDLGDKVFYGERHIADIENIGKHPSFQLFHDLVTMFNISVDEYFYPAKNVEKNTARRHIDSSLDLLSDNELKIIQGTIDGILNSRENKK